MTMIKLLISLMAAIFMTAHAKAALMDGKKVRIEYFYSNVLMSGPIYGPAFGTGDYIVNDKIEVRSFAYEVEVSDQNILVIFNLHLMGNPNKFNGYRVSDVNNSIDDFTSVAINKRTDLTGFSNSNVSFDADNIWIDFTNINGFMGAYVSIDVNGGNPVKLPEPSSLALTALSLGSLRYMRRRRH